MSTAPDENYDALRASMSRLMAAERRLRGREQQRRDGTLSHSHLRALFVLIREPEATAGALAKEAELNPASVTAMVDQLEERGLVVRRRDARDRRQTWISLTDAGRQLVEKKEQSWRARMIEEFADVTPRQIDSAIVVIDRIATMLERVEESDSEERPVAQAPA